MACGATLKRTIDFDPLHSPAASPKRRRCAPLSPGGPSPQKYLRMEPSPFGEVSSRLTAEQILHNIKQEYKRMQKRRHLENSLQPTELCCSTDLQHTPFLSSGPSIPGTISASPLRKEQALFTLRQVGLICERLLKEREDKVREEYEEILTTKLAEQYDAFVKFTHDQIMRRYGEQPASYVS
ncbi:akirin-2 [Pelobates cultripes]|uniref:Akirin-2 n=1 Tax=Pelobates cultripes TaxID=61616 RepID=A0AAD1VQI7_PELCU|nr:akirin-2 [Pelobates cultripes]